MLRISVGKSSSCCDGLHRRDFLQIGSLGLGGLSLAQLLAAREATAQSGGTANDRSVIWLWLGGGPTHVETFDPKMTAPAEYRSITGEVQTCLPGVSIGGTFPKIAALADKMAFVRSFAHTNSGHGGGTHYLMTGFDNRTVDNGGPPSRPSLGSTVARVRGANHPVTGVPRYVRYGQIGSDGASYLGAAYAPFDPRGEALRNLSLSVSQQRVDERLQLLKGLDRINRQMDQTGLMDGLTRFEQQAFSLVLGEGPKAFDLKYEDARVVERYGPGLGQQLLAARRICQAGCGFVSISYGGWDMHNDVKKGMEARSPQLDHAVAAYLEDVDRLDLSDQILLVITGEFGRTPKVNATAGRDHWAPLSTLALAGGGLRMGQVVGESASKLDVPKTVPITPQDLAATLYRVLGIDQNLVFLNAAGRPSRLVEAGTPVSELFG